MISKDMLLLNNALQEKIFDRQKAFHEKFASSKLCSLKTSDEFTKEYVLCMLDEATEVLREVNWKLHTSERKVVNRKKLLEEMIDLFKYWLNILVVWGFTAEDFTEMFISKSNVVEKKFKKAIA